VGTKNMHKIVVIFAIMQGLPGYVGDTITGMLHKARKRFTNYLTLIFFICSREILDFPPDSGLANINKTV
jgi:hypothetical protein